MTFLEFPPLYMDFSHFLLFQDREMGHQSRSLSKSLRHHNRATNLAFKQQNKENLGKTTEITIKIVNTEQKIQIG